MILKSSIEIPETERVTLREAATRINDIANSLLARFRLEKNATPIEIEEAVVSKKEEPLLTSVALMELLTDKKYEYPNIQWTLDITPEAHFCFIAVNASALKRSLSNVMNNAVEACQDRPNPQILVRLEVNDEVVTIFVEDNGQGIPSDVLEKINAAIAVTAGKENGHGIGLMQVREMLAEYNGVMQFDSALGQGTQVRLQFPRVAVPAWMAERVALRSNDIILVLDDDTSIHGAWDTHFQSVLNAYPDIQLHHFSQGQAVLDFVQSHYEIEKSRLFLLSDYELLKQDMDGLTVIEKSQLTRTMLVTSHYANPRVRERAAKIGCKILPKPMASEITIVVESGKESETSKVAQNSKLTMVDLVIVDDDVAFVKNLQLYMFSDLTVVTFESPEQLLAVISDYRKDTLILLDNQFANSVLSGKELAEQLHKKGYTKLCLLTGQTFKSGEIPDYVTVIRKDDIDKLSELINCK